MNRDKKRAKWKIQYLCLSIKTLHLNLREFEANLLPGCLSV